MKLGKGNEVYGDFDTFSNEDFFTREKERNCEENEREEKRGRKSEKRHP